jgi:RNA polymerase primary sigma factor
MNPENSETTWDAENSRLREIVAAAVLAGELTYDSLNDLLGELQVSENDVEFLLDALERRGIAIVDAPAAGAIAQSTPAMPAASKMTSVAPLPKSSGAHEDLDEVLAALRKLETTAGAETTDAEMEEADAGGGDENAMEDAFRQYMNRMGQTPLLSEEEERRLALLARDGSPAEQVRARQALAEANLRLVVSVARAYAGRTSLPFLDIMQEGNIGLMRAIERYDPDRYKRLASYATWWIRRSIGKALADHVRSMRLPGRVYETVQTLNRLRRELEQKLNRQPSRAELAEAAGLTVSQVDEALRTVAQPRSLESPVGESADIELGEVMADETGESPAAAQSRSELRDRLQEILDDLPERERAILMMRFGLGDFAGSGSQTHDDIAGEMHLSRERVRQLETRALRKLRRRVGASNAGDFSLDLLLGGE